MFVGEKQLPDWSRVRDDLIRGATDGVLLPFFGAALSSFPPSSLPLGGNLLDAALEGVFPSHRWSLFASDEQSWSEEKQRIRNRSTEVVLQGLAEGLLNRNSLADFYNQMCNVPFNRLHKLMIQALNKASIPAIFTTNQDRCLEDAALTLQPIQPIFDITGFEDGLQRRVFQFHGAIGGSGEEQERRRKSLTFTLHSMGPRLPEAKRKVLEAALDHYVLLFMGYSGADPDVWYTLDSFLETHPHTRIYWCVRSSTESGIPQHVLRLQQRRPDTIQTFTADMWDVLRQLAAVWGLEDAGERCESADQEKDVRLNSLRRWIPENALGNEERQLAYGWLLVAVGRYRAACEILEKLAQRSASGADRHGQYMHMMFTLFAGYARRELSDHQKAQKHLRAAARLGQELDRVRYAQAMHKLGESLAAFDSIHLWHAFPKNDWLHPGARCLRQAISEYRQLKAGNAQLLASEQLGRAGLGNALMNLGQLYRRIGSAAMTFPITRPFWRSLSAEGTQLILESQHVLEEEGDMRSLSMSAAALAAEEPGRTEEQRTKALEESIELAEQWNQDYIQIGSAYYAKAQFLASRALHLEGIRESRVSFEQALDAFQAAEMGAEIIRAELDLAGLLNREARERMKVAETSWEWQFGLRFLGVARTLRVLLGVESLFALGLFILVFGLLDYLALPELALAGLVTAALIVAIVIVYEIYRVIRP